MSELIINISGFTGLYYKIGITPERNNGDDKVFDSQFFVELISQLLPHFIRIYYSIGQRIYILSNFNAII
ncbi:hypothetical protein [Marinigracilibium pacificum]|uniref:Uncharacterized protein n=1 Tax=Marinigracilibium pacificum TaxID=2729599 RepID=A0A848J191_9BACT|nr:hypothetical protein [Marinigracilibium pacificum]NMM49285.1 hypothetical protein [Marinigracilibium pacificum]